MGTGDPIGPPGAVLRAYSTDRTSFSSSIQANEISPCSSIFTDGPTRLFTLWSVTNFWPSSRERPLGFGLRGREGDRRSEAQGQKPAGCFRRMSHQRPFPPHVTDSKDRSTTRLPGHGPAKHPGH